MRGLLTKLALLAVIVMAAQAIIAAMVPAAFSFPNQALLDRSLEQRVPVIYFGDSTLRRGAPTDRSAAGIPAMLEELLPGMTVAAIDQGAYHGGIYAEFARYIRHTGGGPRAVVVPVNLRTFSAGWWQRPDYQFVRERALLRYGRYPLVRPYLRPLMVFNAMERSPLGTAEFRALPVYDGRTAVGRVEDFENSVRFKTFSNETLRDKLIYYYMASLDADHPLLADLEAVAAAFRDSGTRAVLYVTPVDHETGARALGPRFADRLRENIALIGRRLAAHGTDVLDLTFDLGADAFAWSPGYPNEHLTERGRRHVAARLAERVTAAEGAGRRARATAP